MRFYPWDLIRKRIFCLPVALRCKCGFLVINTVASFWVMPTAGNKRFLLVFGRIPVYLPGVL